MYLKQEIGKFGENKACEYLQKNEYKIIERNFLCRQGEIDIVAVSKFKELIFVEVKTRRNLQFGMPCEAVTPYKIKHIIKCAKYYIHVNKLYNKDVRFDVIEVYIESSDVYINHIKNAF